MSVLGKMKRLLPVSSRSFHAFEHHANEDRRAMRLQLTSMQERNDKLHESVSALQETVSQLREAAAQAQYEDAAERDYEQQQSMMLFWQLFRRSDESLEEAQLRFFRSLPKAAGINRLFQDTEAKLFAEFDRFCKAHDVIYWATGGTLLGAYRHQDFIPWDDDIDVYITRDQLGKLEKAVRDDNRYRITVIWDWYVPCKQIRFRLADENNPAFVDLFTLDWAQGDPQDAWEAGRQQRAEFTKGIRERFAGTTWSDTPYLPQTDPLCVQLESLLADNLDQLRRQIHILPSSEGADALVRGPENIDEAHSSGPYPAGEWLPTDALAFRDIQVPVPPVWRTYLKRLYGDYLSIPKDMNSHEHVADSYIASHSSVTAMRGFLGR